MIAFVQQVHEGERFQRLLARGFQDGGVSERADHDVFGDREIDKGFELLKRASEPQAADAVGPQAGDVAAIQKGATGIGWLEAGDQVEQVDLPAPFGPMMPTISPSFTSKAMLALAISPPKRLVRPWTSSSGLMVFPRAGECALPRG